MPQNGVSAGLRVAWLASDRTDYRIRALHQQQPSCSNTAPTRAAHSNPQPATCRRRAKGRTQPAHARHHEDVPIGEMSHDLPATVPVPVPLRRLVRNYARGADDDVAHCPSCTLKAGSSSTRSSCLLTLGMIHRRSHHEAAAEAAAEARPVACLMALTGVAFSFRMTSSHLEEPTPAAGHVPRGRRHRVGDPRRRRPGGIAARGARIDARRRLPDRSP